jgi:gamma-glutamylcyclotransferase
MTDQWYFAYGSNLSQDQKEARTGAVRSARVATLHGFRLVFNKRSKDGSGKANIVVDDKHIVWGVAYLCDSEAMAAMDRFEGVCDGGYCQLPVAVRTAGGEYLDAVTYVAGEAFVCFELRPSQTYLNTILEGARSHGFPKDYVGSIVRIAGRMP